MISERLRTGRENATPARTLCDVFKCDRRELVAQIQRERLSGIPICASNDAKRPGYFLPEDDRELAQYCRKLEGTAAELMRAVAAIQDAETRRASRMRKRQAKAWTDQEMDEGNE